MLESIGLGIGFGLSFWIFIVPLSMFRNMKKRDDVSDQLLAYWERNTCSQAEQAYHLARIAAAWSLEISPMRKGRCDTDGCLAWME